MLRLLLMLPLMVFGIKLVPRLFLTSANYVFVVEKFWRTLRLEHIVHHCPAWAAERREAALAASALDAPPCVKMHGLLPAPHKQGIITHEPALASRPGVHIVWTDGSGRHSSNP
eukprot:4970908-Amphidinium_carterae.1